MLKVSNHTGFNAGGGFIGPPAKYVAIGWGSFGAETSPHMRVYNWSNATGFGTVFANPAVLPNRYGPVNFNRAGNVLAMGTTGAQGSPGQFYVWPWSAAGFGTRFALPASRPTADFDSPGAMSFAPGDLYLSWSANETTHHAYPWNNTTGFGVRYAQPSGGYAGASGRPGSWHPTNLALVVASNSSPLIQAWPWLPGFGTRYANPVTAVGGSVPGSTEFDPTGVDILISSNASPWLSSYKWTNASGFGTKYAAPSPALTSQPSFRFSPDGRYIAITNAISPYIRVMRYTAGVGFGAIVSSPSVLPSGTFAGTPMWTPDQKVIMCGSNATPWLHAWQWSEAGFGTKYSNPATLPPRAVNSIAFSSL